MSADTGGYLTAAMGEAMLHVLVEELGRLPFDTQVTRHEHGHCEVRWRAPYVQPGEPTVIARAVRCIVADWVPGVTVEYLDAQGGWTPSLADARVFERDEHSTHREALDVARRLTLSMFEEQVDP